MTARKIPLADHGLQKTSNPSARMQIIFGTIMRILGDKQEPLRCVRPFSNLLKLPFRPRAFAPLLRLHALIRN